MIIADTFGHSWNTYNGCCERCGRSLHHHDHDPSEFQCPGSRRGDRLLSITREIALAVTVDCEAASHD